MSLVEKDYVKNRIKKNWTRKDPHKASVRIKADIDAFIANGGAIQVLGVSSTRNEAHTHTYARTARGFRDPSGKFRHSR